MEISDIHGGEAWKWWLQAFPKHWYPTATLHSVTTRNVDRVIRYSDFRSVLPRRGIIALWGNELKADVSGSVVAGSH